MNFDATWRLMSRIEECKVSEVTPFIEKHYLHKRPAIVLCCLRMVVKNEPVGCIIFAAPPRETSVRYGGETWELARLFIEDSIPRNAETWLIGKAVKWVRRNYPTVRFLVSYADPSAGHQGTIYKAANWRSDGRTDQERKTPRFDYVDSRTGKKYGRRGNMPSGAVLVRQPRVSKARFVYKL